MEASLIPLLRRLDLAGVMVSAELKADGALEPVGGIMEKLIAAIRERRLPRIHTFIVSHRQDLAHLGLEPDPQRPAWLRDASDRGSALRVIPTANLPMVIDEISLNPSRFAGIDCGVPDRGDFVGREKLLSEIDGFVDRTASGYLVLCGGMGRGKTTLLEEIIRRAIERDEAPAYHIIKYGNTPRKICSCLYARLRKKYGWVEPADWAREEPQVKLDLLLRDLSERELVPASRREVLYLDAADQAEALLLPGHLPRELPENVVCIITTRVDMTFMRTIPQVTVWEIEQRVDDRVDVARYMHVRGGRLSPPLSATFVQQVVSQPVAPVFFTVATCLRGLEEPETSEQDRAALRTDPSLWVREPETLVIEAAERLVGKAAEKSIDETTVWRNLALLALAKPDELSEQDLQELKAWDANTTGVVFDFARSFFRRRPALRSPREPYRFDHPGYEREVLLHLADDDLAACHEKLGRGCLAWREMGERGRGYALRHGPAHLTGARAWNEVETLLTELRFLEAKTEARLAFELGTDLESAAAAMPASHSRRSILQLLGEAARRDVHFLDRHPSALLQCLWNSCWWYDCDEAKHHYAPDKGKTGSEPAGPWFEPGEKLYRLVERWREQKQVADPRWMWVRSLRPPKEHLGAGLRAILGGHEDSVRSVSFSPDGRLVASGSDDRTIRLWDTQSGRELRVLRGHEESVTTSVNFSPDGRIVASGSDDMAVRMYDAESGRELRVLCGHTARVRSVSFSPDGQVVASGSDDNTVRLWDTESGRELRVFCGHEHDVTSVSFSPDGRVVASGSHDKTIRLWDTRSGRELLVLRGHRLWVFSVSFSPDGRVVASGSDDRIIRLWDTQSGRELRVLDGHEKWVRSVSFSPDGLVVASGSDDQSVRLWDTQSGREVRVLRGHEKVVTSVSFRPDGRVVASGSDDKTVRLWDTQSGLEPRVLRGHKALVSSVSFSPDGRVAASRDSHGCPSA